MQNLVENLGETRTSPGSYVALFSEDRINKRLLRYLGRLGYNIVLISRARKNQLQNDKPKKRKNNSEEYWWYLTDRLKRKFGINLFKTVRRLILALNSVQKENFEQYDLKQKIKI